MVLSPLWYLYLVGNWYCYLKTIPIWILNVTIIVTCRECSRDQSSRCSLRNPLAVGSLTSCSGWRSCKKVGFLFLMEVLQKCVIFLFLMDVLQKCFIFYFWWKSCRNVWFLFLMLVLQKCVLPFLRPEKYSHHPIRSPVPVGEDHEDTGEATVPVVFLVNGSLLHSLCFLIPTCW